MRPIGGLHALGRNLDLGPHDGVPGRREEDALGVDLDSVCGGRALCGRCQVSLAEGVFAKHAITSAADHVSPVGEGEARCLARRRIAPERRLGCQAFLLGDVVVDVPAEAQVHRQVVRKRAEERAIAIDPVVRLHYVEVPEPLLEAAVSDLGRLRAFKGSQKYAIPAGLDLTKFESVVIWCEQFKVLISPADLKRG